MAFYTRVSPSIVKSQKGKVLPPTDATWQAVVLLLVLVKQVTDTAVIFPKCHPALFAHLLGLESTI